MRLKLTTSSDRPIAANDLRSDAKGWIEVSGDRKVKNGLRGKESFASSAASARAKALATNGWLSLPNLLEGGKT